MHWINEPSTWDDDAERFTIAAEPGTDTWREPKEGGVRTTGHACLETITGDFTVTVRIAGNYAGQYDQAGLMVRKDDETWLKCGVEYVNNEPNISAVITRGWSDWSLEPLGNSPDPWIRVERKGAMVYISFSLDGKSFRLIRKGYFTPDDALSVGRMAASPNDGFTAVFTEYTLNNN